MKPGKEKTRVWGNICSEFIYWAHWRTLMRTAFFLFFRHTTRILVKVSTWCFQHSNAISCFLLVNPSKTDKSWERGNMCLWIYMLWIYLLRTQENTDENSIYFFRSPHHKHFDKAQDLVFSPLLLHQLFTNRYPGTHWWVLGRIKQVSVDIYALNLFIVLSGAHWWEQNIFCFFTTPQGFWKS